MSAQAVEPVSFHVSHVRVEISCALPEVQRSLKAIWQGAAAPLVPASRRERFAVRPVSTGFAIEREGLDVARADHAEDILPMLESALYRAILEWHANHLLLHGALVGKHRKALLLLGASSHGKSSLAAAAIAAGFAYASDELVVVEGERLWGIPRAVQFEAVPAAAALPPWASRADRTAYPLRLRDGRPGAVPVLRVPARQVWRAPLPLSATHIVEIARGAESVLCPITPLEAAAAVYEAAFWAPTLGLGDLLGPGRAWRLSWSNPAIALRILEAALGSMP